MQNTKAASFSRDLALWLISWGHVIGVGVIGCLMIIAGTVCERFPEHAGTMLAIVVPGVLVCAFLVTWATRFRGDVANTPPVAHPAPEQPQPVVEERPPEPEERSLIFPIPTRPWIIYRNTGFTRAWEEYTETRKALEQFLIEFPPHERFMLVRYLLEQLEDCDRKGTVVVSLCSEYAAEHSRVMESLTRLFLRRIGVYA